MWGVYIAASELARFMQVKYQTVYLFYLFALAALIPTLHHHFVYFVFHFQRTDCN